LFNREQIRRRKSNRQVDEEALLLRQTERVLEAPATTE
jgi:hypothetical protein